MLEVRSGHARAADGVRLWWRRLAPCGAPRQAPALVLCNGAACTIHYWPRLTAHFVSRMPVVQWDYRGHGLSERGIDPATVSIEGLAADLGAVLEAAGVERAVLVGHSLGVQVVLEGARRHRSRTEAAVCMFGTFGEPARMLSDWDGLPRLIGRGLERAGRLLRRIKPVFDPLWESRLTVYLASLIGANRALLPPGSLEPLIGHIRTMDPAVALACFRAALEYSARGLLPQLEVPLLIFAGGQDRMTPPAFAREMARLAPRAELCVLPHASHLGLIEDPASVHYRLEMFLAEQGLLPAARAAGSRAAARRAVAARAASGSPAAAAPRPAQAPQPAAATAHAG
ncbi:MAG: alpha/beta hydrolase [Planctomycetota bacterium]|nr:MAG: alpha/beta hydrolase [Planctomycetota bacterium]